MKTQTTAQPQASDGFKVFGKGALLFCDYAFGGKPRAKCIEVIEPGSGKSMGGKILVELMETQGAYRKGERVTLRAYEAVPRVMELPLRAGQFHRRVSTLYRWE